MFDEDNHGDYHADRHLLRGRCSICMIYDENVVIIYDKKEFSIERMFRPSLVFPSTLWTSWGNIVISSSSTSVTVESYYHALDTWTRTGPGWCHSCSYQTTAFIGNNPTMIKVNGMGTSNCHGLNMKSRTTSSFLLSTIQYRMTNQSGLLIG